MTISAGKRSAHRSVALRSSISATAPEPSAYLAHPVLGSRLLECVTALQDLPRADAEAVFGNVDALKLRSSLTLFMRAGGGELFEAALQRWFSGKADERTDHLLSSGPLKST